jgi:DNA topoisomerase-3
MSRLYIAEKPSVARSIADAIGGARQTEDYISTSTGDVVCAARGHLLELADPEDYDPMWRDWTRTHHLLPFIPEQFRIQPRDADVSKEISKIKRTIKEIQPTQIVNACDAGREGELIFRYIWQYLKLEGKFTMKRLWLQSMTSEGIRQGIQKIMDGAKKDTLALAAQCRSESDWIVGISGSRAATNCLRRADEPFGRESVRSVGRVQTPTLALIVDRDDTIKDFKPKTFWTVVGTFKLDTLAQTFDGLWFNPTWEKSETTVNPDAADDRLFKKEHADAIAARVRTQSAEITEKISTSRKAPPRLYDLTTLQRDANKKLGWTAADTLKIAQNLYEKQKAITYPRTDATALPEDYPSECVRILDSLEKEGYETETGLANEPNQAPFKKSIFDNSKISDHFAIIPTGTGLRGGSSEEQVLYKMLVLRFVAVFCDYAEIEEKMRTTIVQNEEKDHFRSKCSTVTHPGWQAIDGVRVGDSKPAPLPGQHGDKATVEKAVTKEGKTTPPEAFTEASLLGAMENAGKAVEDEELREALSGLGLGTPATRAATIERLKSVGYITVTGKKLKATAKGTELIHELRERQLNVLTSPELTGDWELKLAEIEKGSGTPDAFMHDIAVYTKDIVAKLPLSAAAQAKANAPTPTAAPTERTALNCPICSAPIVLRNRWFNCEKRNYRNPKSCWFNVNTKICQREITQEELAQLIEKGETPILDGFKGRANTRFSCKLVLNKKKRSVDLVFEESKLSTGFTKK